MDEDEPRWHLPQFLHSLVSSRSPSPDAGFNHDIRESHSWLDAPDRTSLSNIEFRKYSPTPLGRTFAQKGSGKFGGKAQSYGYDKPTSYSHDFKTDRFEPLGTGLFGSSLSFNRDNHREIQNKSQNQAFHERGNRGGGKPSRARGGRGRGRGNRHKPERKTSFPGYNPPNDKSDYFNSRMRNMTLGTSISTAPSNSRNYSYKSYYNDDRERERDHKYNNRSSARKPQMKQRNKMRENIFRDDRRNTKHYTRKAKHQYNRYRSNSDTRSKRSRPHTAEEVTKSVLPDPPSSHSSSSTNSHSGDIDFAEETQSVSSRNHSPSPTPSTNSARSSVASIGLKNRTTSLAEVAEADFVEVEQAIEEIDEEEDEEDIEEEVEEDDPKEKEEEPPTVKVEKKKPSPVQAPSSTNSNKSKRKERKQRERKATPSAGRKNTGRRKSKKEKKQRKDLNGQTHEKTGDDYWLEAATRNRPPPPQKSACAQTREKCGTVCRNSRTVFGFLWTYLQVVLEYSWYLFVYLVRNFYEMHKHAFRAIGDHHLLFRFSFLYGFPKLTEEMLFWAPPWSPHMIWCLFASHISIWWGVVLFFVPPEVLSSSGLLQQLNPSERLVIAYVLCVLRQQNFGKPLLITVLVFLSLLSLFLGDYLVVQWIVCLVATFNIDEQTFSGDSKGKFMPPRLIHDDVIVDIPGSHEMDSSEPYRYNRRKKKMK